MAGSVFWPVFNVHSGTAKSAVGSGVTLLWLCLMDLVLLAMRRRPGGDGWSSQAVAAVIIRIAIIKLMKILRIRNKNNINSVIRCCRNRI